MVFAGVSVTIAITFLAKAVTALFTFKGESERHDPWQGKH